MSIEYWRQSLILVFCMRSRAAAPVTMLLKLDWMGSVGGGGGVACRPEDEDNLQFLCILIAAPHFLLLLLCGVLRLRTFWGQPAISIAASQFQYSLTPPCRVAVPFQGQSSVRPFAVRFSDLFNNPAAIRTIKRPVGTLGRRCRMCLHVHYLLTC